MLGHNSDDDPTAFGLGLGTRPTRDQVELMRDRKTLDLESALLKTRNDRAGDPTLSFFPTNTLPARRYRYIFHHSYFLSFVFSYFLVLRITSSNGRAAAVANGLSKLSKASKCLLQSLSVQLPLHLYQEEVVQPFSTKLTPIPTTFIQPPS